MNWQQVIFGLLEFLISIFISLILIFLCYRFFLIITHKFDDERKLLGDNRAVGIVLGSVVLGEALVVKQAIYPVIAVIQIFILGEERSPGNFLKMLGYGFGYILLTAILALISILFSFWLFNKITPRLDHYEEIKKNNVAVAIFVGFFVVSIAILMSAGVAGLTKALIPFPTVGSIAIR